MENVSCLSRRLDVAFKCAQTFLSIGTNSSNDSENGFRCSGHDLTCRHLFIDSSNLLDQVFSDPLAIDYFNVYLSLPIFGQRALRQRQTDRIEFDPPSAQSSDNNKTMSINNYTWLIEHRTARYMSTDIYIENLLATLLNERTETENSQRVEQSFTTVDSIHDFHRFLEPTAGIKYWEFFIDTLRLLRSRHTSRCSRFDISSLNYIHKYYSRKNQFRSIVIEPTFFSMPDGQSPDAIYFLMAFNAAQQLKSYWVRRYFNDSIIRRKWTVDKRSKLYFEPVKHEETMKTVPKVESEQVSIDDEPKPIPIRLKTISYIPFDTTGFVRIQSSLNHPYQNDCFNLEEPIENDTKNENHTELNSSSSSSTINDYVNDRNIELIYRILISDSLAGSPFHEYLSSVQPDRTASILQNYLRFIGDCEVLLSTHSQIFHERILQQFIGRYFRSKSTDSILLDAFIHRSEDDEHERWINQLFNRNQQKTLLWPISVEIIKMLMPHFIRYIQFDRLQFLLHGKSLERKSTVDVLNERLPSIPFHLLLLTNSAATWNDKHHLNDVTSDECPHLSRVKQAMDQLPLKLNDAVHPTEKRINTNEQYSDTSGSPWLPSTSKGIAEDKIFDDTSVTIRDRNITKNPFAFDSIKRFASEILYDGRILFEANRFVTNLIDESIEVVLDQRAIEYKNVDDDRLTESPIIIDKTDDVFNTNASKTENILLLSEQSNGNRTFHREKILSSIGCYFINRSCNDEKYSSVDPTDYFQSNKSKIVDHFKIHHHSNSSNYVGFVKQLVIDHDATHGHVQIDQPHLIEVQPTVTLYTDENDDFLIGKIESFDSSSITHLQKPQLSETLLILRDKIQFPRNETVVDCESQRFAPKDQQTEISDLNPSRLSSRFYTNHQQQILDFIPNQINNHDHQWPLIEYIGLNGHRAWRALKLASDISNFSEDLMLHYHRATDWISDDNNLGSFSERTHFIERLFRNRD